MQQTQSKLFVFLWKHKRDRIKRQVLVRPLSKGSRGFPCFSNAIKALHLSWIGRLLSDIVDIWRVIPNHYFGKRDGLLFLLNCNNNVKTLDNQLPLFYRELLQYFQELCSNYEAPLRREFILWNNKKIMIENESGFWKTWAEKNVFFFVQDLLTSQGTFLSLQEFRNKYNINVYFLHYCQITSAIPAWLKNQASINNDLQQLISLQRNFDYQLSEDITFDLRIMHCKQFYKLFVETIVIGPTAIKSRQKKNPEIAEQWVACIQRTCKITCDNK